MTTLKINPKFQALCPTLTAEEYSQLEANIIGLGRVREEIILWKGTIVDGHNRYEIATKHGIPFDTSNIEFENEAAACNWIIDNQLGRRNLTESQRAILAAKRVTTKKGDNRFTVDAQNCASTQTDVAETAAVSRRTMQSAAKVVESHDKSLEKAVVDGKLAVDVAAAVAKLPERQRAAFETGAVKANAKTINALAKKPESEISSLVTAARKGIKPLDVALGIKKPPVNLDSEPEPPKKKGQPTTDVRKWSELETAVGKIVRMNTDLKEHCQCGLDHHETIRQHLNGILSTLKDWRKECCKE